MKITTNIIKKKLYLSIMTIPVLYIKMIQVVEENLAFIVLKLGLKCNAYKLIDMSSKYENYCT